jgi:hypothetical protein
MPAKETSKFLRADRETIIAEIQRVAKLTEATLTREFLFAESEITRQVLHKNFGGFEKAAEAAGLPTYRVATSKFTKQGIESRIKDLAQILGQTPTQGEFLEKSGVPRSAIIKHFGKYNTAVRSAGLNPRKEMNIEEDDLLFQVLEVFGKVKGIPSKQEWNDHSDWNIGPIVARWGGLREAVLTAFTRFSAFTLEKVLATGEGIDLEFKETARWDINQVKVSDVPGKMIVKTVAAFANTEGGDLFIGVNDAGEAVGLERDLALFGKQHTQHDEFQQYIHQLIWDGCSKSSAGLYDVTFHMIDETEICRVTVKASKTPIYVKDGNGDALFVRVGNTTRPLSAREIVDYTRRRFNS